MAAGRARLGHNARAPFAVSSMPVVSLLLRFALAARWCLLGAAPLAQAQRASGAGVTQTIRTGLKLVAASKAYSDLRGLRGKVRFSRSSADLKSDR